MKKSILIGAMLITAAFVFTSCENPNNSVTDTPAENTSDQNTGNENPSNQKEQPVTHDDNETQENTSDVILPEDFKDCTKTIKVSEIVLSDGNWAVKAEAEHNGETQTYNLVASVTGGVVKYNSGTFTVSSDLADYMTADEISSFKQLTQAQKEEMISQMSGNSLEEVSIRIEGTKVFLTTTMSESDFSRHIFKLDEIPVDIEIKTNAGKTKYTFSRLFGDGFTATYYINKL